AASRDRVDANGDCSVAARAGRRRAAIVGWRTAFVRSLLAPTGDEPRSCGCEPRSCGCEPPLPVAVRDRCPRAVIVRRCSRPLPASRGPPSLPSTHTGNSEEGRHTRKPTEYTRPVRTLPSLLLEAHAGRREGVTRPAHPARAPRG